MNSLIKIKDHFGGAGLQTKTLLYFRQSLNAPPRKAVLPFSAAALETARA
jgi:hypothetical protein